MKRIFDRYEPDNWKQEGSKILSDENVTKIKQELDRGPIIIEQCFYRGACSPQIFTFEYFEDFEEHIKENAVPGDIFTIWSFFGVCNDKNNLAQGKLHDTDGCIPETGAY